ncbi:MAG TPA: hypothetical protein VGE93_00250 [Bryobacteraceae bacterium]|nr:hypothetical protein [Acidobacteriaceae bacterium]
MYGLRNDIDLNFLVGRTVEQVAIGTYEVIFGFDENVKITVYQEFRYFDGQAEWVWQPEAGYALVAGRTVALLGFSVEILSVIQAAWWFLLSRTKAA